MNEQYKRNFPTLSREQWERLRNGSVCIVGCGGLGGYNAEYLARVGVGNIRIIDGDRLDETNLNRQILSRRESIGCEKVQAAKERIASIDPDINVEAVCDFLTDENAVRLLSGCNIAVDALDSAAARLVLARACGELSLPLVHGAVSGWLAQAGVLMPGSEKMKMLYPAGDRKDESCLSFTPAACAAIQSAEAVKLLCGMKSDLEGKLALLDMQEMEMHVIEI